MRTIRASTIAVAVLAITLLGACAQGRKSYSKGKELIFEKQQLCSNSVGDPLGCFEIEVNYTANYAYLDVIRLDNVDSVTGETIPLRVLARRANDGEFFVLADGVVAGAGQYVEVTPHKGHYIEEYVEWRIELVKNFATNSGGVRLGLEPADAGNGLPVVQAVVNYPELLELE